MSELPPGWVTMRLGDLGRWIGGGTPSKAVTEYWGGSIPWVSPKDMKVDRIRDTADHVSDEAIQASSTTLVAAGSVLVVTRSGILSHTLPVAVTDVDAALNQDLKALIPEGDVDSAYVAWALRSNARQVLDSCSKAGTTVANIDTKRLLDFEIPVAPLAEQLRIVASIEEQFSRLDAATELLRSAARRADALWRSQLMTAFDEQCDSLPLSRVLEHSIGGTWGTRAGTGSVDVAVFRVTEFRDDGVIDPSTAARRAITSAQLSSRELREDDLLLEKSGGGPDRPVGRIAWVGVHDGPAVCSNFVQLLRVDKNLGDSRYVFYWLTRDAAVVA